MREILFRGKRISNGQFVSGDLECNKISNKSFIHTYSSDGKFCRQFEVDPATVGQYTGVVDKNGKQVFEDDIIGYTDTDIFGVVNRYHEGNFYINTDTYCNYTSDNDCANVGYMMNRATTKLHVIGNIHDNPALLKGGEQ